MSTDADTLYRLAAQLRVLAHMRLAAAEVSCSIPLHALIEESRAYGMTEAAEIVRAAAERADPTIEFSPGKIGDDHGRYS